jgi:hypothetical protein
MSGSDETAPRRSAPGSRSIEVRRAARQARATREKRVIGLLNRGVSVAEIAAREGLTLRRMRAIVQEILARRMPQPPAEFLALQISRLNEALIVSYGSMGNGNLQAVDRYVKIVRELDRYHGFGTSSASVPVETLHLASSSQAPLALGAPSPEPAGKGAATD